MLLNRFAFNHVKQLTQHCSPPKEGAALTAVLEGEDVTVRGPDILFRTPRKRPLKH